MRRKLKWLTNFVLGYIIREYQKFRKIVPEKEKTIKKTGQVIEALPSANFKVKLEDGQEILAHLSGRMRMNHIRVLVGDKVVLEMSRYDNNRGRIVLRGQR